MGHAIGGGFLKATNKDAALKEGYADACEFAFYNVDRGENPSGSYDNSFRYYDKTFDTEDDAMDFFYSLGSYCDGVCKVKEAGKGATNRYNKKIAQIEQKKREFKENMIEKFKERKSKSVGCKKCNTRIDSDMAIKRRLICPSCGNWLVTDTVKERYAKFDVQRELAEKQYAKDCASSDKVRFFAKYEVHC